MRNSNLRSKSRRSQAGLDGAPAIKVALGANAGPRQEKPGFLDRVACARARSRQGGRRPDPPTLYRRGLDYAKGTVIHLEIPPCVAHRSRCPISAAPRGVLGCLSLRAFCWCYPRHSDARRSQPRSIKPGATSVQDLADALGVKGTGSRGATWSRVKSAKKQANARTAAVGALVARNSWHTRRRTPTTRLRPAPPALHAGLHSNDG